MRIGVHSNDDLDERLGGLDRQLPKLDLVWLLKQTGHSLETVYSILELISNIFKIATNSDTFESVTNSFQKKTFFGIFMHFQTIVLLNIWLQKFRLSLSLIFLLFLNSTLALWCCQWRRTKWAAGIFPLGREGSRILRMVVHNCLNFLVKWSHMKWTSNFDWYWYINP